MSESSQNWYNDSRVIDLEYLNLELPKYNISNTKESVRFYCFHKEKVNHNSVSENHHLNYIFDKICTIENNISCTLDRLKLGNVVSSKHSHNMQKTLEKHQNTLDVILKNQKSILNKITQLGIEVEKHKPLTAKQVTELVEQIAKQPKLVEAEALRLTENLSQEVQKVQELLLYIKGVLT